MSAPVMGLCPMGCGSTLFLGSGGYVTCSWCRCPNPSAVSDLLLDHASPHHIVVVAEHGFHILHPLRERLAGELFDCDLHKRVSFGQPFKPGRYEVTDKFVWRELVA